MTLLLRLCGVAMIAAAVSLILKKSHPGQAVLVVAAGLLLLLAPLLSPYAAITKELVHLLSGTGFDAYGALMLKALGIGVTVKLAGDLCRSMGEETLAGGLELAGKLEILLLCLPLMRELLALLREVMG
ncbi:MAG: hypothetical protein E7630_02930 [Ruminococcaceae bacterium]|nr:hypothetical protein [Oscillospiraceae bacterium]